MKNSICFGKVFWLALSVCLMLTLVQPNCPASARPAPAKVATVLEGVVNLNTASEAQLTLLPGVGEAVARRIIAFREQHGPFQRPEDLMNVQGIGERTFDKLRPHLAVEGESTLKSTPTGGSAAQAKK
jgi:competence protein ComEA